VRVVVVDLQSAEGRMLRAVESALATAKATERRAATLLELAKASPEILLRARGIYVRAGARVRRLHKLLEQSVALVDAGQEGA
jgi:hypothetical protein